jgi:hypothetical protein
MVLVAAAVVVGACGGGSESVEVATLETVSTAWAPSSVGSAPEPTAEDIMLLLAQCIRDNGVDDFEDPVIGDKGQIEFKSESDSVGDQEDLKKAYEVCSHLLEGTSQAKDKDPDGAGGQDQLYELAVCMRAIGFDMPDPNPTGDPYAELDKTDPDFIEALEQCEHVFGSAATDKQDDTDSGK